MSTNEFRQAPTSPRLTIYFDDNHNGDGLATLEDYKAIFEKHFIGTQFQNVMEWCCGPAFVGFTFLAEGIFRNLTCADIEADVERSINETLKHKKNYNHRVNFIQSDCFDNIDQKFDLIVGNPPHFIDDTTSEYKTFLERNIDHKTQYDCERTAIDWDWLSHKKFFQQVKQHLKPGGYVILNENSQGATEETFEDMIAESGLQKHAVYVSTNPSRPFYWYMILKG